MGNEYKIHIRSVYRLEASENYKLYEILYAKFVVTQ